jgi:hypothetical protein
MGASIVISVMKSIIFTQCVTLSIRILRQRFQTKHWHLLHYATIPRVIPTLLILHPNLLLKFLEFYNFLDFCITHCELFFIFLHSRLNLNGLVYVVRPWSHVSHEFFLLKYICKKRLSVICFRLLPIENFRIWPFFYNFREPIYFFLFFMKGRFFMSDQNWIRLLLSNLLCKKELSV